MKHKGNLAFINGEAHKFNEGEYLLDFIKRIYGDDYIPTLCDAKGIDPIGSCRICSVEVSVDHGGPTKTVASCHTPVESGIFVKTHSEELQKLRKNILELVLTDHPLDCLICEANGNCELQNVASRLGITEVRYSQGENHLHYEKDVGHTFMRSDLSKCINCQRCISACDEIQGQFVLSMKGRGFSSKIIKGDDGGFAESECVSCGLCSQICPTSAISDVFKPQIKQATKTVRTICTYCGVGCNLDVAVNNGTILGITAPEDAIVNQGHACLKGRYAFRFYNHKDRLKEPQIRKNGKLETVSWDEAYDYIAEKLTSIKSAHGPSAIAGISSSRCTNEENYLMQKFIRAVVGTNNIDGCARICHAPTATGMQRAFGMGAATNSIIDLDSTNCILVVGANPTAAHPVTGAKIKQKAIQGIPLIVVDPRKTELASYADIHLQLKPGTNVALLNMMLQYIVRDDLFDKQFLENRTEGFEDFKDGILKLDPEMLELITGVDKELVRQAAHIYAKAESAMCFHGLGVTEHLQGTYSVMLIADLAMITGNIGRKGMGVNPLRGQNNVQGAADMGVQPNLGAGYLNVSDPSIMKYYSSHYGVSMPEDKGLTIPDMFDAALDGKLKALWIMGEHVMQTEPNIEKVGKALDCLDLLVVQEIFPTETAMKAHVVLPASSFFEKNGTFTNGERRIQRVNRVISPIGNTKPDGQIVSEIMQKLGYPQPEYKAEVVLEEISNVVPFFKGVTWENLGENGKQWPVAENGDETEILHINEFKRGKGKFHFFDYQQSPEIIENAESYPLTLTTNRALEHYNCGTMTRRTGDSQIMKEDVLLVNKSDARRRGVIDGEEVKLSSARSYVKMKVKFSDQVNPGVVSTTFHFPEQSINKITSDVVDTEATCPEYKVVAVEIEPWIN